MSDIVETSAWLGSMSLAVWTQGLRPESPCFCCGSPFRAPLANVAPGKPAAGRLKCARCGAEVLWEEVLEPGDIVLPRDKPLVAAA
jgi:hypothetical protein